jgi:hypothetical protein
MMLLLPLLVRAPTHLKGQAVCRCASRHRRCTTAAGERAKKEKLMAQDRNPGIDNQERPEQESVEQVFESPKDSRGFDLPEEDTADDDAQSPAGQDER